jgi:hypothetical protein
LGSQKPIENVTISAFSSNYGRVLLHVREPFAQVLGVELTSGTENSHRMEPKRFPYFGDQIATNEVDTYRLMPWEEERRGARYRGGASDQPE